MQPAGTRTPAVLELSDLAPLASLPLLRELSLNGNPALSARRAAVTTEELLGGAAAAAGAPAGSAGAAPSARTRVLTAVPQVRVLDGELNHAVERQEREAKAEARRLSIARSTSALIEKKKRAQEARQAAEAAAAAAAAEATTTTTTKKKTAAGAACRRRRRR